MPLSAPPNQPQPPPLPQPALPLTLKARIICEYRHWADLPAPRFGLLVLPICLLIFISPLLPFVAYALWHWASSSWAWRDRWASIWALAWRGGAFVAFVLLVAALGSAHVWIFPQLTATLQAFWRAHLPGELSLTPIFDPSLMALTLLLLPLAPALTLYFERVDPRTRVQQQRILTARDLAPKKPKAQPDASTTAQEAASPKPGARAKPKPKSKPKTAAKATPREPAQQHSEGPPPPPEQITIDSHLALNTDQVQARPAPPSRPPAKKSPAETVETSAPAPAQPTPIDWNDVAE